MATSRRGFLALGLRSMLLATAITTGLGRSYLAVPQRQEPGDSSVWLISWGESSVYGVFPRRETELGSRGE